MAAEKADWLAGHITYLSKLKAPTDTQKLLLLLAGKKERDAKEERTFAALVKSEKALERAKKARAEVAGILADEKKKAAKEERAGRTHKLIQLGLLFSYAGLDDAPRDFLTGLLMTGAKMDEQARQRLAQIGAELLAQKEPQKSAAQAQAKAPEAPAPTPPAPAPAPVPAPVPVPAEKEPVIFKKDVILRTEFTDRDEVKRLGAKWHADEEKWCVPAGMDARPFARWIP
jgi:hypothetical protein